MKNNIFKKVLTGALVACSMVSCDYLDVSDELGGISSFENIFNNVDRTKRWYGQIYADRPDYSNIWGATNAMGGAWAGYADEIYTREHNKSGKYGDWNSSATSNHRWGRLYESIRQCNVFLEMAHPITEEGGPSASKITEEEMALYKANARFMRAVYHYYLFEMYGPIPIVKNSYVLEDIPNLERSSVDAVVEWIDRELGECMEEMWPEPYHDNTNMRGVPTKGTALAYRAKLWVYAASDLYNGTWEYGKTLANKDGTLLFPDVSRKAEKINTAVERLKDFIEYAETGDRYKLYYAADNKPETSLYELFMKYNSEIIWATTTNSWGNIESEGFDGHATPVGAAGMNGVDMLQELVDDFYGSDGLPIEEESFMPKSSVYDKEATETRSYADGTTGTVNGMYLNREPRFYNSVTYTGMEWVSNGMRVNFSNGGNSGVGKGQEPNTGYMLYKRYARNIGMGDTSPVTGTSTVKSQYRPSIIFRLAEFYLLYAEMLNERGNAGDKELAIEYVDKVRKRAGIPTLQEMSDKGLLDLNQKNLREIIRRESRIELCTEGQRYFDICRWLIAKDILNKDMHKLNTSKPEDMGFYNVINFNRRMFSEKNYLYPIPLEEIQRSEGGILVQNPGW